MSSKKNNQPMQSTEGSEFVAGRDGGVSESMSESVGQRLQNLRTFYGLSQRELARRADVTNSMLSAIEHSRASPSISSLEKILKAFPVTLQEFFSETPLAANIVTPAAKLHQSVRSGVKVVSMPLRKSVGDVQLTTLHIDAGQELVIDWLPSNMCAEGILIEGEAHLVVEGLSYPLHAGDGFCFLLSRSHQFKAAAAGDCTITCTFIRLSDQ